MVPHIERLTPGFFNRPDPASLTGVSKRTQSPFPSSRGEETVRAPAPAEGSHPHLGMRAPLPGASFAVGCLPDRGGRQKRSFSLKTHPQ